MATAPIPAATPAPPQEIRIIAHSTLYYWWIVWAVGFLMAIVTFFSNERMAVVPAGTESSPEGPKDHEGGAFGESRTPGS